MAQLNEAIRNIPIPIRMRGLPISDQGFPLPWFTAIDEKGVPVPQAADPVKRLRAYRLNLCWCCGIPLGVHKAFVIGPMCCVNRATSEPPNHRECAEYAVRACPFLTRPRMKRNPTLEDKIAPPAGLMIERNPGVAAIWITRAYRPFRDHDGGVMFALGEPSEVFFYCEGRLATRAEVVESIDSGLPNLRKVAEREGKDAITLLEKFHARALQYLPEEDPSISKRRRGDRKQTSPPTGETK